MTGRFRGLSGTHVRVRRVLRGETLQNIRRLWFGEGVSLVFGIVAAVLVARHLGPKTYGRYALATNFSLLAFVFIDPRPAEAVTRYVGVFVADGRRAAGVAVIKYALVTDFVVAAGGMLLIGALYPLASGLAGGSLQAALWGAVAAASAAPLLTARAVLGALNKFADVARLQRIFAVLRAAAVIAAVLAGYGLIGILVVGAASAVLETAISLRAAMSRTAHALGVSVAQGERDALRGEWQGIRRFVIYSDLTTMVGSIIKYGDSVILGAFAPSQQVAYYRLAKAVTGPIGNVSNPLQSVVFVRFSNLFGARDSIGMRRAARRSLLLGGALGALFLATVPLIPPLVTLTAGQKYAPAAPMAQMLLAGSAIGLAGFWMRPYYLASGAVRQFLVASVVAGGLAVLGFFVAAPRWEGMGVATVRVVCISVLPFALLFRGLRRLNADQPAPAVK